MGVIAAMKKKEVSPEFKKQCVASYLQRGKRTLKQVSADFDINSSTLSRWVSESKKAAIGTATSNDSDVQRIIFLEKENLQQKLEIDFLKKMSFYLAKEGQGLLKKS